MTVTIEPVAGRVQLVDAYLHEVTLERKGVSESPEPSLFVTQSQVEWIGGSDRTRFAILLQADLVWPFNDGRAVGNLSVTVAGIFAVSDEMTDEAVGAFAGREGLVLVYPYLRSMVGQLWRLTGIPAPPIPTMDVLGTVAAMDQAEREPIEAGRRELAKPKARRRRSKAADGGSG